jgi:hypothetical protein
MSDPRLRDLARRQQALLVRSTELRLQLGHDLQRWQAPLAVADEVHQRGRQAWGWLRNHPEVPLAAGVALLVLRPRRVLALCWRWGRRAWLAKGLYDRWRQALHKR